MYKVRNHPRLISGAAWWKMIPSNKERVRKKEKKEREISYART